MPKYWNRQRPRVLPTNLPPAPTAAFRIGQSDFLNSRPLDAAAFRVPELQAEYRAGWLAEAKDLPC